MHYPIPVTLYRTGIVHVRAILTARDMRAAERIARQDERYPLDVRFELADAYRQIADAWERSAATDGESPLGCEYPFRTLGVRDDV